MLEQTDLQDEHIIACVQDAYGLRIAHVAFLPLGADRNTVFYRVVADDETPYFLKLRAGDFDETSVAFPKCLSDQGIEHIIAPLTTKLVETRFCQPQRHKACPELVEGNTKFSRFFFFVALRMISHRNMTTN